MESNAAVYPYLLLSDVDEICLTELVTQVLICHNRVEHVPVSSSHYSMKVDLHIPLVGI